MVDAVASDAVECVLSQLAHLNITDRIQESRTPVGGGACGDIFQGRLNPSPTDETDYEPEPIVVAIKTIRANYKRDRVFVKVCHSETLMQFVIRS